MMLCYTGKSTSACCVYKQN